MAERKPKKTRDELIEFVVVIMLGITAVATAWSSWQGGLHGSQMDQKYTKSNNYASEGNSEYNAAIQTLTQDMMIYHEVNSLMIDQAFADESGNIAEMGTLAWKIDELVNGHITDELVEAVHCALEQTQASGE